MTPPDILVTGDETWHGATTSQWRDRWGVPALRIYRRVGSTNDVARELAEEGAEQGTVVLTDEQTRGRGRRGRTWHSGPGTSLLLSMVLRPGTTGHESLLPLRIGLGAARAIESITPLQVGLKWPNDLVIDGRKLGGLLCEGAVEGERAVYLIAGVGINVFQQRDDFPDELAGFATSIAIETREPIRMADLAGRVIAEVLAVAGAGAQPLSGTELRDISDRDVLRGRNIEVEGESAGVARGVAPDGALLVESGDGVRRVLSGTVRALDHMREPST